MKKLHVQPGIEIHYGDCRDVLPLLPDGSVNCCVTSPPYWGLRDYGHDSQIGHESTPEEFVAEMVRVFAEVRRILVDDGVLWLNLGDVYQNAKGQAGGIDPKQPARRHGLRPNGVTIPGLKPKDLVGIPWAVAFALRADGWYLRSDCIWSKPNAMPEPVEDRPTRSHEYLFLLSKSRHYWYDGDSIAEPGAEPDRVRTDRIGGANGHTVRHSVGGVVEQTITRNARSVWTVNTQPYPGAHFAVFPPEIPRRCIKAGCPVGGKVLDPFHGSGTTMEVARELGRHYVGIELNPDYIELSKDRVRQEVLFPANGERMREKAKGVEV